MRDEALWRDRYIVFLCAVLCGYAVIGKGFAMLGVAPLFIGECALGLGLCAMFAAGSYVTVFATAPSLLLVALFAWIVVRTIPGVRLYGMIALRDAVIVGYGAFALIVVALLSERPERLATIIRLYRGFAYWYGMLAALIFYLVAVFWSPMPKWPGTDVTLVSIRPGEIAVHLAGAGAFMLAGLRRTGPAYVVMLLLGIMVISPSRGASLACVLPLLAAIVLTGKTTRFMPYLLAGAALFALAYALDLGLTFEGGRSMGPRQMVNDAISIFGNSGEANMDNTKAWRLSWWQAIQDYTLHGKYFWTGKGFGQSLAEIDGFLVGEENGGPLLRSPHNAHLTILARTGVPGLVLWLATLLGWFAMLARNVVTARARHEPEWAGLFVWVGCYVAAILIDASFDVALEGPMLGIWFWCLFGLGIASTMIYRTMVGAARAEAVRTHANAWRPAATAALLATLLGMGALQAHAQGRQALGAGSRCPAGAIGIAPGQPIQAAVDAAGPMARFCLRSGIHRQQSIVPMPGQRFYGEVGSVLDGARILATFERHGQRWTAHVLDPVGADHGVCAAPTTTCARPAGLFVDDVPVPRANSLAALRPGQFSFDPARGRLVLAIDPAGHLVEWAMTRHAFSGPATGVLIDGIVIEKYANPAQSGAVWPGGAGWQLRRLEARYNNGVGLVGSSGGVIQDCDVHHNGQLGIGAGGAVALTITGNRVWANNTHGFDDEWEAGGIKLAQSRDVVLANNHVHHNNGPGLWCDEECRDVRIEGNTVEANGSAGIFYEISDGAVIRDNVLDRNDTAGHPWLWGAEIQLAASSNVVVTGNTITVRPGGKAVMLIDQNRSRARGGTYQTRSNRVEGNRIVFLGDGMAGGGSDAAPGAANHRIIQRGGNAFDFDTYLAPAGLQPRFIWGEQPVGFDHFRALGQERHGRVVDAEEPRLRSSSHDRGSTP